MEPGSRIPKTHSSASFEASTPLYICQTREARCFILDAVLTRQELSALNCPNSCGNAFVKGRVPMLTSFERRQTDRLATDILDRSPQIDRHSQLRACSFDVDVPGPQERMEMLPTLPGD